MGARIDAERATIRSLLDTDFYKLTMQQAVFHRAGATTAEYAFFCRSPGVQLAHILPALRREVCESWPALQLTRAERNFLEGQGLFKADYLDFLADFRFDPDFVEFGERDGKLEVRICGPWVNTILFETPLLATINELYFRESDPTERYVEGRRRLEAKLKRLQTEPGLRLADFGARRRWSRAWHEQVIERLMQSPAREQAVGTSNVDLARRFGLASVGTMAHEFLQAPQALVPPRESQRHALNLWLEEYKGALSIALTDVIGMDAFLRDFDAPLARAYAGLRHDSGDPLTWGEKAIAHYERLGIDPASKLLVFSDGLDADRALAIYRRFAGRARLTFGIGTNLTNDLGPDPIHIVLKMVRCNGRPVAKLSDEPTKAASADPEYIEQLRRIFAEPAVMQRANKEEGVYVG